MFKLSNRAALDEINKLIELQVLKSQEKGRALHNVNVIIFIIIFTKRFMIYVCCNVAEIVDMYIVENQG